MIKSSEFLWLIHSQMIVDGMTITFKHNKFALMLCNVRFGNESI